MFNPQEPRTSAIGEKWAAARDARFYYWTATQEWSLVWPCHRCGGASLPLLGIHALEVDEAFAQVAEHVCAQPCPGCTTRHNRAQQDASEPLAWYDTAVRGWVVRTNDAIQPLDIRWYDVPRRLVELAASQVLDADC